MIRVIKVARKNRCPYPPIGKSISPPGNNKAFEDVAIQDNFINMRLRPVGSRQSESEANVLSKIKAIVDGRAMGSGDILGR